MNYRILLVDDHPIYREGLTLFIDKEPNLTVCGAAEDAHTALEEIDRLHPHLAVVDLQLKNSSGFWLIEEIARRWPDLRILVLTMYDEERYADRLLESGAHGFVMKDQAPDVVLDAIRSVLRGVPFASEKVKLRALRRWTDTRPGSSLTSRELDVLRLAGEGRSVPQIATVLKRSPKTIQNHILRIQEKLELGSRQTFYQLARDWVGHTSVLPVPARTPQ